MKTRQSGVAIVLAMGVVALAAIAATAMMVTQSTWSRHNELGADHVQAQALVQVGVDWTRALLADDRRSSNVDTLGEPWALRLPPIPVENGTLAGRIEDQQGRFNLNNLVRDGKVNLAQLAHFQALLSILGLPPALGDALVDWIDADDLPYSQAGAEDAFYLGLPSPHLAANQPLMDVAELALVRGFNDSVRLRLRPFVAALPVFTAVNLNTAAPEVIAAVVEGLDLDGARALVEKRDRSYLRDRADFLSRLPGGARAAPADIGFASDYFLVQLRVTVGDAQARSEALLARTDGNWPAIVWRKML
jgi:general secretion pathway protein K